MGYVSVEYISEDLSPFLPLGSRQPIVRFPGHCSLAVFLPAIGLKAVGPADHGLNLLKPQTKPFL